MQNVNISILGLDLIRNNIPSTCEEINALAGNADAALSMALNYWSFHVDYNKLRPAIAAAVEALVVPFGDEWKRSSREEEGARGKRTVYDESEKDYLARISDAIESGELEGVTVQDIVAAAQAGVDGVPVKFDKAVRGTGGGEPAKKWLAYYDEAESQDVVAEKIEAINKSKYYSGAPLDIEDEDLRIKFALACKEIVTKRTRELSII